MTASVNKLINDFVAVRHRSVQICASLETEDYCPQPNPEVSPPKWHLGHTTWFFENLILNDFIDNYTAVEEQYFFIFNSYYETFGDRLNKDSRSVLSRPTVRQVMGYRNQVDTRVLEFFSNAQLSGADLARAAELLEVGIHHEQQHQELLLMDIKFIFSKNLIPAEYFIEKLADSFQFESAPSPSREKSEFISVPGGLIEVGYHGDSFSYDHENPRHKFYLEDFKLKDACVTNGEFLEFIGDGGYQNFKLWLSDGWEWLQREGVGSPLYWREHDDEWQEYHLGLAWQTLDLNLPVSHVSFYESSAFANWRGARLPNEHEWEHASNTMQASVRDECFFEGHRLRPIITSESFQDLHGSLWEWTASAFAPYPGYQVPEGALAEYNSKFMSNQMVLKGGSYGTPLSHYRNSYRNFFLPNQRWQFSGIRLARF